MAVLAPLLLALAPLAQDTPAGDALAAVPLPELAAADLAAWRTLVRPSAEEAAWASLPWIPEFAAGVLAAAREGKPLLFWAMNGHPLGCT